MTAVAGTRPDSTLSTEPLSTELIRDVLAGYYGLRDVTQEPLGGEVDQNVKITTAEGHRFALKASPAAADTGHLHWQNAVLAHLAEHAPDVAVPRVLPARSGDAIVRVSRGGADRVVRLFTWVAGDTLREVGYHPPGLLAELGTVAGTLVRALSDMRQPDRRVSHDWDMRLAPSVIGDGINAIGDPACRADVEHIMAWYGEIAADLGGLPHQVVHQDLNDANVLVRRDQEGCPRISGVVDVNDALYTIRVAEIAVCAGYAMVRKDDPLRAAATVIAGFDSVVSLTDAELSVVFPLAAARLCMNATTWNRRVLEAGSQYGQDRMRHTWPAIQRIAQIVPEIAAAYIRRACGRPARWAAGQPPAELTRAGTGLTAGARQVEIDLAPGADLFDEIDWTDDAAIRDGIRHLLGDRAAAAGVTAHLRPSLLRSARREAGVSEPATVQLGCGLLLPGGRTVPAPVAAVVERAPSDDGPLVLRHDGAGRSVWTCWWGIEGCPPPGSALSPGAPLGTVSARPDESGLDGHVQVVGVWSGRLASRPLPRHVRPAEADAWNELSFDPRRLLGLEAPPGPPPRTAAAILASRREHFAKSQRAYYRRPMNLVRGRGTWLYDDAGLAYLDSLNNVTHVGHCEPRVTAAAHRQMRKLNTNSRFIYEGIASYAERLAATLPAPLEVVFLVCTGSEANDLALRIARQVTGRQDVVVLDGAYHGNTGVVTGISPNRYKGPGGAGAPPTTHEVPIPDRYRGAYGYDDPDAGAKFAADAARVIDGIRAGGHPPAALIAESLMGSAGNIVLPDGYLAATFAAARAAGALCISDEVQVGVGRMGDSFWGFELGGVVPDIVTMGKPLGNGHPLAAVVTTRAIADAFDTGMKYFNTFGGNPVSCAVGQSVLDIVQQDGLQAHARELGAYFLAQLTDLKSRQPLIGDVRGQGLYLGVELVRDPVTKQPAAAEASMVTELMKERGVITFPNGVHDNVLKIKPPMVFQRRHVDLYVHVLDQALSHPQLRGPVALRPTRSQDKEHRPMTTTAAPPLSMFVAGRAVPAADGATEAIINPATGGQIATAPLGSARDVDVAVRAAGEAFEGWAGTPPGERARALLRLADRVDEHAEELAQLESVNVGKPITVARAEIPFAADNLRFFAGAARVLEGRAAGEYLKGRTSIIRRDPLGVVGSVAPWNFPLLMAGWKIGPALMTGNTLVLKPSELTPLTTLRLAELAADLFPPGVLNVVTGHGETVGAALVSHPRVRMSSLTGDVATGKKVLEAAAGNLKRVHLELGGKAPVIVYDDADVDLAVEKICEGAYGNSGQDCMAATRVYAAAPVHDDLIAGLTKAANAVVVGDPADEATQMGPVISEAQRDRIGGFVERACAAGARLTAGGAAGGPGFWYRPSILAGVRQHDEAVQKEIFGPVVTVTPFGPDAEALRWANDVEYGLAASVFTSNVRRAMEAARVLQFGTVWINDHMPIASEMPHGGFKQSGQGNDMSIYSLEEYTEIKHVMINLEQG